MTYKVEPTGCRMSFTEVCGGNCRLCIGFRLYLLLIGIALWIPGLLFTYHSGWREQLNILQWGANTMLVLGCFILILGVAGWVLYLWELEFDVRSYLFDRQKRHDARRKKRQQQRARDVIATSDVTVTVTEVAASPIVSEPSTSSGSQVRWLDEERGYRNPALDTSLDMDLASELGAASISDAPAMDLASELGASTSDLGAPVSEHSEQLSAVYPPSELSATGAVNSDYAPSEDERASLDIPHDYEPPDHQLQDSEAMAEFDELTVM